MNKCVVFACSMTVLSAFAGWNGAGVSGGTGANNINDPANWTDGSINGDFSAITLPGPTALALTDNLTFTNGVTVTTTATFTSGLTGIALSSTNGLSVGQVVNGNGIAYNTVLIGVSGSNTGVLSQATLASSSGNYTFTRPALNLDFGVIAARATNVVVTFGSDSPATPRTITLSGRVLQTQLTRAASPNAVTFSTNIAFALTDQVIITRETGAINAGTTQPRLTINGLFELGAGGGNARLNFAGGDMALNGVVSGAGSGCNLGGASTAGTLTLTNPDNSYSGGNTSSGGFGSPLADSTRVLADTGFNSALGSAGNIGLNDIALTLQGFSTPQITDRSWNVGNASLVNYGTAPVVLTGTLRNDIVAAGIFALGSTYQNYGKPNVLSGLISNGAYPLSIYVSRGVWLLNNDADTFSGSVSVANGADQATLQFTSVADMGVASALGAGTVMTLWGAGAAGNVNNFEYTGTNSATGNRVVNISGNVVASGSNVILANGLGTLELSGVVSNSLTANGANTQTRALFLGGLGSGILSGQGSLGDITNGSNIARVSIYKAGTGSWTLSGSNFNYQGETEIRAGTLTLDYTSYDQFPGTTSGIVRTDGGTLTFKGKPVGTTLDTLPVLQIGADGAINRSSTIVFDANGGTGFNLTVGKLEGDTKPQKFDLIDLSSSAGNSVTVNATGTNLKSVNGVLMNVAASVNPRSLLVVSTATGYGFAALSGATSGTLQPLGGQTALPATGYANTANYILNTAGTVTPTADVNFSTLTLDTGAGATALVLGSTRKINPTGSGRGVLLYGTNSASISGSGTITAGSIWFHNYLDTNATLAVSVNIPSGVAMWGGPGFTLYTGTGLGTTFCQGGGIFRVATAQNLNTSLSGGEFALANSSVFEIGADLNGAAAGDFSYPLGTATSGKFALYGSSGLSAWGATRVVNFGGASAALTWGSSGFLTYAESAADYGYALRLSSVKADATLEIQNPINLNGNSAYGRRRTVEVADGGAAVDARLSGALSGNAALVKSGAGTLDLTGAQSYDGPLMVMGGTLRVGAGNIFTNTLAVQLRGGGLSAASGTNTLGRLELYADSVIDTGDGTASLAFADSSASVWGGTLTINGRLGPTSLRFGTDADGLTAVQIAGIRNRGDKVAIDANGYLRRIPSGTFISVR